MPMSFGAWITERIDAAGGLNVFARLARANSTPVDVGDLVNFYPKIGDSGSTQVSMDGRGVGKNKDHIYLHLDHLDPKVLHERLPGISPEVMEAQLAHGKAGPLGMAYDRAEFMDQRRQMMQTWADYLDRLRDGAQVIPFRAA